MADLKDLKIDRNRRAGSSGGWSRIWILIGVALFLLLGAGSWAWARLNSAAEVEIGRVALAGGGAADEAGVILNATGYIIAAHKIEVGSKVMGRVAWIGVDKGDRVREGQVIVRLEDEEYRAQLTQAQGQLLALESRLAEALAGSRPEEVAEARALFEEAKADLENARINLARIEKLAAEGVFSKQNLDDARARFNSQSARVSALERRYELVKIGPRQEQIQSLRGQVEQARGVVAFAQTQLDNTVIKAPVTGTILERAVEKGEFVTTSFVGERGAKGYVVSLADLNDLEVELDISQNDFARLSARQLASVTTDAYPDRKYAGKIVQISPEANRQKATVQVKVKILEPDDMLRPDMNATVAFLSQAKASNGAAERVVVAPAAALKDGAVFVVLDGRVERKSVRAGARTSQGVRIEQGLNGGEDVVLNPPATLRAGDRVKPKQG